MINVENIEIEPSWKAVLKEEFEKTYFRDLFAFVKNEYLSVSAGKVSNRSIHPAHSIHPVHPIYPQPQNIFRAFEMCPFDNVKVVILGQDPYHGTAKNSQGKIVEQANGLSFSVDSDISLPPSLKNIFKEIKIDLNIEPVRTNSSIDGDLSRWAKQGVLLLNSTLTVQGGMPGSHQKKGWEEFTDAVIRQLSERREHIVFILWGNYAKQKGLHIDRSKHLVLEAAHPSPFSAYNGFFGCKHFSKTNEYLRKQGLGEIDWR